METGRDDIQRSVIYYCDPMQSGRKDGPEQAHTIQHGSGTLGEDALKIFQLRPIAPDEVNLMPKLIRFNR